MHSYFSNQAQRPIYRNYSIFVAEVASTVNEALLLRHLERCAQGDVKKLAYLANSALEQFRATLFRQTMFAEFELKTHEIVEQGGSLTPDLLDELYRNLCADYFGSGVVIDEQISREWSRIPHFYYDFYVYQYATGFAAAQMLSERILKGGAPEYLRFLSRGDSVPPLDALREAGADLATEKPVADALALFAGKVRELEGLL
jgi:oligoendopeptidase F